MSLALCDAGIDASEVDHINAHGTATPQNDAAESRGFRRVFGDRVLQVPVTSIKSMIGHCLGAAGAVEAAVAALTVARGAIPPTIHHGETDADCSIDVVANDAREMRVRVRRVDVARVRRQRLGHRAPPCELELWNPECGISG